MFSTTAYTNYFDQSKTIILGWDNNGKYIFKIVNPTNEEIHNANSSVFSKFPNYATDTPTWKEIKNLAKKLPAFFRRLEQVTNIFKTIKTRHYETFIFSLFSACVFYRIRADNNNL